MLQKEKNDMSEQMKISQTKGFGSHENTLIGVQNNQYGLTHIQAIEMAFSIFKEYYPQLRQDVLNELDHLVKEKLRNVPENNIVSPTPRIAVPVLQNASITEEYEIRELYANLLSNSMNKIVKDGVHPAYVEIIKQLSPDEAKILSYMRFHTVIPTVTLRKENDKGEGTEMIKNFSNIGEISGCEQPFEINKYFNNLIRLGILECSTLSSLTDKKLYEPLKNHKYVEPYLREEYLQQTQYNKAKFNEGYMMLTDFGKAFCEICLNPIPTITVQIQESENR